MTLSRKFLVGLAMGMLMTGTGVAQAETLQDAVRFMLQSNPDIRAQSYNRMAREKEVRQAKAGYLPTIDVNVAAGLDRQHEPFFDTTWPASATISVRQNVFRFFGTQSEVERQEARLQPEAGEQQRDERCEHGASSRHASTPSGPPRGQPPRKPSTQLRRTRSANSHRLPRPTYR